MRISRKCPDCPKLSCFGKKTTPVFWSSLCIKYKHTCTHTHWAFLSWWMWEGGDRKGHRDTGEKTVRATRLGDDALFSSCLFSQWDFQLSPVLIYTVCILRVLDIEVRLQGCLLVKTEEKMSFPKITVRALLNQKTPQPKKTWAVFWFHIYSIAVSFTATAAALYVRISLFLMPSILCFFPCLT